MRRGRLFFKQVKGKKYKEGEKVTGLPEYHGTLELWNLEADERRKKEKRGRKESPRKRGGKERARVSLFILYYHTVGIAGKKEEKT